MIKWLLALLFLPLCVFAQESSDGDYTRPSQDMPPALEKEKTSVPDPTEKTPLEIPKPPKKSEWVAAPIPNYSPAQGWGLAVLVQKIFGHGEKEKPTMAFGSVFGTEKKSYGALLGYMGRLQDDQLRVNVFGGYAKINSDFYGIGKDASGRDISVLLEQEFKFVSFQITPKWKDIYIGPALTYSNVQNKFNIQNVPPEINPEGKLTDETWVPGLKLQADTRDNTFYPQQGYLSNVSAQFHDKNLSGSYTFQQYKLNHNAYVGLGDEKVVALRANLDATIGDVPFYDLPSFGQGQDMRGYKAGKYRDKIIWDGQAEYRQRFTDHWGGVVFGGVGDVIPSMSDLSLKDLLWAGGIGVRYRIGAQNPIDFRVDVAYGDKETSAYFSVNQAY